MARDFGDHEAPTMSTLHRLSAFGLIVLGCSANVTVEQQGGGGEGAGVGGDPSAGGASTTPPDTTGAGGTPDVVERVCDIDSFDSACGECVAAAMQGPCSRFWVPCTSQGACDLHFDCVAGCEGEAACCDSCRAGNEEVAALFDEMVACAYCDACGDACGAAVPACGAR